MPEVAKLKEQPIKNLALFIKNNPKLNNKSVGMVGINTPTFSFYLQKITPNNPNCEIIFTKLQNKNHYKNYKPLKQDGAYILLERIKK